LDRSYTPRSQRRVSRRFKRRSRGKSGAFKDLQMLDEVGLGLNKPSPSVGRLGGSGDFGGGATMSDVVARGLLSDLSMGTNHLASGSCEK
jgi:hypothetical protein